MQHDSAKPSARSALSTASALLARVEAVAIGALMLTIFGLLMLNVVTRSLGAPVIWVDELAVLLMIWIALIGASLALAHREHIAVTLLSEALPARPRAVMSFCVDLALFGFFVVFAVILWRWFDPITLWKAGSVEAFSQQTFNFLYQEPTVTLGVSKVWFWMIMPVFCVTGLVHMAALLLNRKGAAQ